MNRITCSELGWCAKNATAEEDMRLKQLLPSAAEREVRLLAALMFLRLNQALRASDKDEFPLEEFIEDVSPGLYEEARKALIAENLIYETTEGFYGITELSPTPY